MARVRISPERYQSFLDAFLTLGPRFSAVAKRVGSDPATARKAWNTGWPEVSYGAPIAKVYVDAAKRLDNAKKVMTAEAEERKNAQSVVKSAPEIPPPALSPGGMPLSAEPVRTAAQILQQSAIDATQSEVDLLQAFRCNLIGAVLVSNKLLSGFEALATSAAEQALISAQNVAQTTPDRLLRPLEKFARIMQMLTTSTKSVIEMQRLLVGAPQQITEQRGVPDAADQGERLQRAKEILGRMQRAGLLPNMESQNDSMPYEGEESNTGLQPSIVRSELKPTEPPLSSVRSGNAEPTDLEESSKYAESFDEQRLSKPLDADDPSEKDPFAA